MSDRLRRGGGRWIESGQALTVIISIAAIVYVLSRPQCEPTPCQMLQQSGHAGFCPAVCQLSLTYGMRWPMALSIMVAGAAVIMVLAALRRLRARA